MNQTRDTRTANVSQLGSLTDPEGRMSEGQPGHLLRVPLMSAALLWACFLGFAQAGELRRGDPAPPFIIEKVLQAPQGSRATLDGLSGKAVVLEFWATWCGPCVAEIRHLNELARKVKDEPIVFLFVTEEHEEPVKRFLRRQSIDGWIGLDTDRSLFERYGAATIPHVVLIDGSGIVRAVPEASAVGEQSLRALAAGNDPGLPDRAADDAKAALRGSGDAKPLFQVMVRPSASEDLVINMSPGNFSVTGATLQVAIANAYHVSLSRVRFAKRPPEGHFDIQVSVGSRKDLRDRLFREALEAAFAIQPRLRRLELDVLELTGKPKLAGKLSRAHGVVGGFEVKKGFLRGENLTPDEIADCIEVALGRIVLRGACLRRGRYDIELTWDADREGSLFEALKEQTGLDLKKTRHRAEVLVVD